MRAVIIAVGDELISGKTVDSNSAYLSARLAERGVTTLAHVTVGDDEAAIADAIGRGSGQAEVVVVSGGLGPTADDVTRHGLARALGAELLLHEGCLRAIEAFFRRRERQMVPGNRVQAMIPAGAEPLPNELGTAAGIAARLGGARLFLLPGVPHEMRRMFEREVSPRLPPPAEAIAGRVVHAFGTGESDVAALITDLMRRGANPTVGITVSAGLISVRVAARAPCPEEARRLAGDAADEVARRLGTLVVGEGDATMASVVGERLRRLGHTLATAESCTGGLIGEMITAVPGASDYYLGGVVAYSNRLKGQLLGVPADVLAEHGAVSEPVARAMAEGARQRLAADWAIGVTGIAGPGGGTEDKPVGLVHVALTGPEGTTTMRRVYPGDRDIIRRRTAYGALDCLRLKLLG